ncbi:IclR family transcriptional regulator [Acidovorax sp.]|uniref:IclR family transcriptional regulator n=1 Tax=Acidovorax sp. TaxID=1872122 RepID=UPI003BB04544
MSSFDKALAIFDLFREDCISVHVEDVVEKLDISRATAYRYLASLSEAGLLSPTSRGTYVLGPRIIELDRMMRIHDPLLTAGRVVMEETSHRLGMNMLLASYYRDGIMCVDIAWPDASIVQVYERGRPMSLFRGAMAKIILAYLSPYQLRNVALHHTEEIRAAGLGADWPAFRAEMAKIAREGTCITRGELWVGALGISAPVFDPDRKILGSITFAMSEERLSASDAQQLRAEIVEVSQRITALIAEQVEQTDSPATTPATGRVANTTPTSD